jgi:hypothetical protein
VLQKSVARAIAEQMQAALIRQEQAGGGDDLGDRQVEVHIGLEIDLLHRDTVCGYLSANRTMPKQCLRSFLDGFPG